MATFRAYFEPVARSLWGPHIRAHGDVHPDEAGGRREHGADQEADRGPPPELVVEAEQQERDDRDDRDRHVLPLEIRGRALSTRARSAHPLAAGFYWFSSQ